MDTHFSLSSGADPATALTAATLQFSLQVEFLLQLLIWSTVINLVLLLLSFTLVAAFGKHGYSIHSRFIPLSREDFYRTTYQFFGIYKICWFVFNVVPLAALLIVRGGMD